ncbi:bifunctional diguanylate cyclase/phosphodiesterase [Silvimonas iriomotensis]|uniref:bifunctional diguanylate cyclase/phosphodiesterase n=1 Tax=Silvimonas iriomotensis TaxID=449662 RepID=UPI001667BF23|nr:EAL domain-containing protein [Silvimonas iriomotensis]
MFRSRGLFAFPYAALFALLAGLSVTALLFLAVGQLEYDRVSLDFRQQANERVFAVRDGLDDMAQVLVVINQLFVTVDTPVTREQFHVFSRPLLARYPYVQALNFHRVILDSDRAAYEAQMRKTWPGFTITRLQNGKVEPSPRRPIYTVVDYLEPLAGNEAALGLDVTGNLAERSALANALATGRPASTGLLQLAQGRQSAMSRLGFVMLMPVYARNAPPGSPPIGDTAAVFRAEGLFKTLLDGAGEYDPKTHVDLSIYAGRTADERNLAYRIGSPPPVAPTQGWLPAWLSPHSTEVSASTFTVAGQSWYVVVYAPMPFFVNHVGSLMTLLGGVLLSLLATAWLWRQSMQAVEIRRLVDKRTAALKHANAELMADITERMRVERLLADREREFRALAENSPDAVCRYGRGGEILYMNSHLHQILGKTTDDPNERIPPERFPGNSQKTFLKTLRKVIAMGTDDEVELVIQPPFEVPRTYHILLVAERDADGSVRGALTIGRDITEFKRVQAQLMAHEQDFRTLAENSPDLIVRYDHDTRRLYANQAFADATGQLLSDVVNKPVTEGSVLRNPDAFNATLANVLETGLADVIDVEFGQPLKTWQMRLNPEFDPQGNVVSVLAVGRDITELLAYRQKIHSLAFYDVLTGLPNRALFNDRIAQALVTAQRNSDKVGVMMLDLDRFKTINDTLGHSAGDDLLCETALRLKSCVRASDTVARLGGDEFILVLPGIREETRLSSLASHILGRLAAPMTLEGRELVVTGSIGIAVYPQDGNLAETLVKNADGALYDAKAKGRNNFQFYSREISQRDHERLGLETDLRRSMARGELMVYYQPKFDFSSGEVIGAEALLRWHHPERGWVAPDSFIGIAEDTGLIIEIGEYVLLDACKVAVEWNRSHTRELHVAVNISPRQVQQADIGATVRKALTATGCAPRWLELEMTESLLLKDHAATRSTLETIYAMGVNIAVDDFGTGYSALSYLTHFPITTLKIDSSFIKDVIHKPSSAVLVQSIIAMAHGMGMRVVAEGVETAEQAGWLKAIGCDMGQGYHWGKAVPAAEFMLG